MLARHGWCHRTARLAVVAVLAGTLPVLAAGSVAAAPSGVTSVTMVSETGDYVGGGLSQLFHPGNGKVTVRGHGGGVQVDVSGGNLGSYYTLVVAAPDGEVLAPGEYTGAQRAAFRQAGRPGLDVSGSGRGCNTLTGRFTVLDVAITDTVVERLHVLYEQHCEGGDPALFGEIRYQARGGDPDLLVVPGTVRWPTAWPGVRSRPVPVTLVNTSSDDVVVGAPSLSGGPGFGVVSNTCGSALLPGRSCAMNVVFTPPAAGDQAAALVLPTTTAAGQRQVLLSGRGEPGHSSWDMRGDPGDYISGGGSFSWTPTNASLTGRGNETFVSIGVRSGGGEYYTAEFAPGRNDVLLPGVTYQNAARYPFHLPAPGLTISGSHRGCNTSTGRFTVHEISHEGGELSSFSATFEQHCEGSAPGLYGSIAYKATQPAAPVPTGTSQPPPRPDEPGPRPPLVAQPSVAARSTDGACPPHLVPDAGFLDVPTGSTHKASIDCLAWWEVARGRTPTQYDPVAVVTRAQMATFIARALRESGDELRPATRDWFSDDQGSPHEDAINRLAEAGIVEGRGPGVFAPTAAVGRGAMTKFLALSFEHTSQESLPDGYDYFRDDDGTTFEAYVNATASVGLATGYADGFRPHLPVRRDHMAVFVTRWLDLVVERTFEPA
jgi:hypothetical protein